MSSLTLRNTKGSPLTNTEVDDNFSALNTDKVDRDGTIAMTGKLSTVISGTSTASIKLTVGAADPSSPVTGDVWNNAGALKWYNGAATDTLVGKATTDTLTNKTVNLTSNTLSGTVAQFNTALSDADFATLAGVETLTNKTVNLTSNTLTGTVAQFNTALSDDNFVTLTGTETLTNKTLTSPTITTPTIATINGVASTNILLDSDADIVLDADGADIILKDGGTTFAALTQSAGELLIKSGATPTTAVTFSGANATVAGTLASGALTVTGAITATSEITAYFSDSRLKNFSGKIENALNKVLQLNGYYFTENEVAKSLGFTNDERQVGVSAQEVFAILPEVVAAAPIDSQYMAVRYEKLVPLLIEAIKELKAELDEVKKNCSCLK